MAIISWMAAFLILLALELSSKTFTTLWFAGGAAAGAAAAYAGLPLNGQLLWFVSISFLALLLVRPLTVLAARGGKHRSPSTGSAHLCGGGGKTHGITTGFE